MDIVAETFTGLNLETTTFVISGTGNAEAKAIIDDLRREVESGRTRWFAVRGTGVETPHLADLIAAAEVNIGRATEINSDRSEDKAVWHGSDSDPIGI